MPGTEPPRARSLDHLEPLSLERDGGSLRSLRAEQVPARGTPPLVRVERIQHALVERVGRGQLDLAHDTECDQNGTARAGTAGDEPFELLLGEHVEQRGGSDQGGAGEVSRTQPGDVVEPGLEGDCGAVGGPGRRVGGRVLEQLGVPVVQHPPLRSAQPRGEPARHRTGAATEVVDHHASGRQVWPKRAPRARSNERRRRPAPATPASRIRPGQVLSSSRLQRAPVNRTLATRVSPDRVRRATSVGGPMVEVRSGLSASLAGLVVLLAVLEASPGTGLLGWATGLACGLVLCVAAARCAANGGVASFGPADLVTLARATLSCGVAALVADSFVEAGSVGTQRPSWGSPPLRCCWTRSTGGWRD